MYFNITFIIIGVFACLYIFLSIKKGKMSIDESFFWIIDQISVAVGVDYPPSLLFAGCIVFLVLMNLRLTKKVADLKEKLIRMAQEIAIIKNNKDEK
jgi:hypothetical protein